MMSLNRGKLLSAPGLFVLYILAASLCVMGFRFFFPGETPPLPRFSLAWRFIRGGIDLLRLFPALALSALVIPFGLGSTPREKFAPFSPRFLKTLSPSIFTAIAAAGLYAGLFLLVLPLVLNQEADLRARGRLWKISADQARSHAAQGDWAEVNRLVNICESIWPEAPEIASLKTETSIQMEEIAQRSEPAEEVGPMALEDPSGTKPVSAAEALLRAEAALKEERYYDAHWLATLGGELAGPGNAEAAAAARIASQAWNAVNSLEPNAQQREAYRIYHLKRDAYRALIAGDWVQAYYLLRELLALSPGDADGRHYLALSEQGLAEMAFFVDEMDPRMNPEGAVFSLPGETGRMVLRFSSLSVFPDSAYGFGSEILEFDEAGRLLWSIETPYVKLLPFSEDSGSNILVLMRALDRMDGQFHYEPKVRGFAGDPPERALLPLNLPWNDFLLLSEIRRGRDNLDMGRLIAASRISPDYGQLPQVFEAELISRLAEPVLFLPFLIFILTLAWRYRALKKPRYIWVPMLGILPLVFSVAVDFSRNSLSNISVWAVIYLGFSLAAVVLAAGALVLFIFSLISLVSQHG